MVQYQSPFQVQRLLAFVVGVLGHFDMNVVYDLERVHPSVRSGGVPHLGGDRGAERDRRGLPGCHGLPARRGRLPESGAAFDENAASNVLTPFSHV